LKQEEATAGVFRIEAKYPGRDKDYKEHHLDVRWRIIYGILVLEQVLKTKAKYPAKFLLHFLKPLRIERPPPRYYPPRK
jgi:hypothetical protein